MIWPIVSTLSGLKDQKIKEVILGVNDHHMVIRGGDVELILGLAQGEYPPVDGVFAYEPLYSMVLDRGTILGAVQKVIGLEHGRNTELKMTVAEQGIALGQRMMEPDQGERVPVEAIVSPTAPITLTVKGQYLLEPLKAMRCPKIKIGVTDGKSFIRLEAFDPGEHQFICVTVPVLSEYGHGPWILCSSH